MKITELLNHIILDGPKPSQNYNKKFESDKNNPLTILSTNTNHLFTQCKDDNCIECNDTADNIWTILKTRINQNGRIRMKKAYIIKMNNFFGETITKKAQNRFNQADIYKRKYNNIIPCTCKAKSHHECNGFYMEKVKNTRSSMMTQNCTCHKHSRLELKRFKEHSGTVYL